MPRKQQRQLLAPALAAAVTASQHHVCRNFPQVYLPPKGGTVKLNKWVFYFILIARLWLQS